ncbi:hypothetical protein [Azospirillum argentinense]|nr:hypothetical protein [Azospirillum argentinense]
MDGASDAARVLTALAGSLLGVVIVVALQPLDAGQDLAGDVADVPSAGAT